MKHSLRNWSGNHKMSNTRHATSDKPGPDQLAHVACCLLLVAVLSGCESLQRKLTRKPKHPSPPPSPIIRFEDYTRTMTPLDRYRKHYLMFDYWNGDLLDALATSTPNPKRYRRASTESLAELETLQSLLSPDIAGAFTPAIQERRRIDQQLQHASSLPQPNPVTRQVESQTRQIHRQFFWRDMQDHLKEDATGVR